MAELYGKWTSLEGGMNSGFDPAVISEKQYWLGVNIISRKGRPSTRPDFIRRRLNFIADRPMVGTLPAGVTVHTAEQNEEYFRYGKFQGAKAYRTGSARYIVALIAGWVWIVDIATNNVYRMSRVPRMSQTITRGYFCQAVDFMIVQDGINRPVIINNLSARVSDKSKNEIPAGRSMAFGHGRIFLQISDRNFIAGDIYKFYRPDSVLKFTEETYLNEGGAFAVDSELGNITGMHFQTRFDTSTGDGPLLVGCENGAVSYSIQNSRTLWNSYDLSKVQLMGTGIVGPNAICDVNQDMMFWSWEGLRSWQAIRHEAVYRRKYTNQSAEISVILEDQTRWLSPLMSMVQVDNRLLMTVTAEKAMCMTRLPGATEDQMLWNDYAFMGIASLDFDQINNQIKGDTITSIQSASYDGLWTGIHPTQLVGINFQGKNTAFAFDKSSEHENRLWEIGDESTGLDAESVPVQCDLYTRSYVGVTGDTYIEQPFVTKSLKQLRLWVSGVAHPTPVDVFVRNEQSSSFHFLQRKMLNYETWSRALVDGEIVTGDPHNVGLVAFEAFSPDYSGVNSRAHYYGHELSFMIRWAGRAEISRMLAKMNDEGQARNEIDTNAVRLVSESGIEKYSYRI